MSKTKDGPSAEGFHQEYIASMRYRNDLPPPEMPPKLLEIPHEGLERFLTPAYGANLVHREDPNIDVDAEGGMPIDLVGIPGLHLGDESAIMAPEHAPPVDPADLPLLMTPEQLRNPAPKNANVSFLRRTQYISGRGLDASQKIPLAVSSSPNAPIQPKAAPPQKVSRDDPTHVKKYIQKGFDIAYPESKHKGEDTASRIKGLPATKADLDAWSNPVHPENPKLKPVGFYPIVPDLGGFSDSGGFLQFKFDKTPAQLGQGKNDERMEVGILVPSAPEDRVCQEHAAKEALHKSNPDRYPDPGQIPFDYDLFLPEKGDAVQKIRDSFDTTNPDRDDESNYTHEGADNQKYHRYDRVRTYATTSQQLRTDQNYKDIVLTLFDPSSSTQNNEQTRHRLTQKGAYYYPILGKFRLKPERARTIAQAGLAPTRPKREEEMVHQIQLVARDPDETEAYKRAVHRAQVDSAFAATLPPPPVDEETDQGDGGVKGEGENGEIEREGEGEKMDVEIAEAVDGLEGDDVRQATTVAEDDEADA